MAKGLKCDNCGKGIMYGHNVSHAKNRTRRIFKPNLHSAKVMVNGAYKTMRLCTKCLRLLKGKSTRDARRVAESIKNQPEEQPQVTAAA